MAYLDNTGLSTFLTKIRNLAVPSSLKGNANGIASLDANTKVPINQLNDSYRKILEYSNRNSFPVAGETDKLYVDKSRNDVCMWNGTQYISINSEEKFKVYSFHIDGTESDPSLNVTYVGETAGMSPAYMDFTNDEFVWGSWRDAFFMPRPCMLKPDGTVDFYLDENDYAKKEDGTPSYIDYLLLPEERLNQSWRQHLTDSYFRVGETLYKATSDIAVGDAIVVGTNCVIVPDINALDNAMMEWGRDGKIIWYKIVPDVGDDTSATVYISEHKVDNDYVCWSFINNEGDIVPHFYTAIYAGSHFDTSSNTVVRSLSGQVTYRNYLISKQREYSLKMNEYNQNIRIWDTLPFCDYILITLLTILISKTTNSYAAFGATDNDGSLLTGRANNKGLFYSSQTDSMCKIFGMENFLNYYNKMIIIGAARGENYFYYKMTKTILDGSTSNDYVFTSDEEDYSGYNVSSKQIPASGYIKEMTYASNMFYPTSITGGTQSTYYCGHITYTTDDLRVLLVGGYPTKGLFELNFYGNPDTNGTQYFSILSCKPLA